LNNDDSVEFNLSTKRMILHTYQRTRLSRNHDLA